MALWLVSVRLWELTLKLNTAHVVFSSQNKATKVSVY